MGIHGNIGARLRLLRRRTGVSLRALAEQAGITPAMISYIENGKSSPSVVTLEKLLGVLGVSLADFFGAERATSDGPVFPREGMRLVADDERSYTVVFPRLPGIRMALLDELLQPGVPAPAFETQPTDVAGYVLSGELVLDIQGEASRTLRAGDAFYVPAGVSHRGYASAREPARLITAAIPASGSVTPRGQKSVRPSKSRKTRG
jgi:transcriptional regulator with XRE-family HTH domain